jgi:K+/H+ antiporter YhaU regulatory subunit KhtT
MIFNPDADFVLEGGDILIVIGPRDQLDRLEGLANR